MVIIFTHTIPYKGNQVTVTFDRAEDRNSEVYAQFNHEGIDYGCILLLNSDNQPIEVSKIAWSKLTHTSSGNLVNNVYQNAPDDSIHLLKDALRSVLNPPKGSAIRDVYACTIHYDGNPFTCDLHPTNQKEGDATFVIATITDLAFTSSFQRDESKWFHNSKRDPIGSIVKNDGIRIERNYKMVPDEIAEQIISFLDTLFPVPVH